MLVRTLSLSLAVLLLGAACGSGDSGDSGDPERPRGNRAVVIGIDSGDWRIIDALVAEGHLPNLQALRERGVSGPLETLNDIALSPVIWTSMATGKTAAKHGITWFMVDQPDGTRVPVRSTNRKTEAVWNILARNGRSPGVLGWWATYPAEDVGSGVIVSDALGFHGFGATARGGDPRVKTYPSELFAQVDGLVPTEQQVATEFVQRFVHISAEDYRAEMFDPARYPKRNPFNPIHLFQQYAVTAQGYTAIAEKLLSERDDDLFMMYYEQVDSFSHLFMKYAPPRREWIDETEYERYRSVVHEWYLYQDELLGRVLAHVDLETTAVFVVSDHGFKSGERRIKSDQVVDVRKAHLDHETDGIWLAAGPHIPRGGTVEGASVLDLTPTLLHYLGLPVAKDMDGKVLTESFDDAWLAENPIRYVPTHETGGPRALAADVSADAALAAGDASETEDALRALGYVGDDEVGPADTTAAASTAEGEEAGEEEVSSPELHNNMGRIHLRNGDVDEAQEEFQKALALDQNNAEALLNLASIQQGKGQSARAQHLIERALAVDPNSIGALAQLAELKRDEGDVDGAIRLFGEALAIDDSQPFLFQGVGDVLQRAGRYEEAEQAFKEVLALEPDSFKARYNLLVTYSNWGKVDEAIAIGEEALELDPKNFDASAARNNLGAIYLARGETDRALEYFEAAMKAAPYNLESRFNSAIIHLDRGDVEAAIPLLEEAAQLQPNHQQVNVRLGFAYLDTGKGEDAYRCLLLVRRLHPDNWAATTGLAVLHARAEQSDQAKQLLQDAVARGGDAARALAAGYPILAPFFAPAEAQEPAVESGPTEGGG
jgi:tetratricopeptide (TPR) repeat protein